MTRSLKALAACGGATLVVAMAGVVVQATVAGVQPPLASPHALATLQHDPQFILEAVAKRMGVTLRPEVPPPTIQLESKTPLKRMQTAAERQWGFRPEVFTTTYATASNEVYLIDEARLYDRYGGTLDDSLAHELVHYIQAHYLGDRFTTDWSESEAVEVQGWFRREFMAPRLAAVKP
jgi:predicted ATPase